MTGPHLVVEITGHWMRRPGGNLETLSHGEEERLVKSHPNFTRRSRNKITVDGELGSLVTVEFPWKNHEWVVKEAVVVHKNIHYFIEGSYWEAPEKWADKAFPFMLKKIKFDRARS